ncbi:MAG: M14 family zinc carboxypeptidase, partial [Ilumatobacteraceae bacterium]
MDPVLGYSFDRFLRHDELVAWLRAVAEAYPDLVELESYGRSHEGRELLLVTITDRSTGRPQVPHHGWSGAAAMALSRTACARWSG